MRKNCNRRRRAGARATHNHSPVHHRDSFTTCQTSYSTRGNKIPTQPDTTTILHFWDRDRGCRRRRHAHHFSLSFCLFFFFSSFAFYMFSFNGESRISTCRHDTRTRVTLFSLHGTTAAVCKRIQFTTMLCSARFHRVDGWVNGGESTEYVLE